MLQGFHRKQTELLREANLAPPIEKPTDRPTRPTNEPTTIPPPVLDNLCLQVCVLRHS